MPHQTNQTNVMTQLTRVLAQRKNEDPSASYVASLYAAGMDKILEKVGEEATEVIIAAKNAEQNAEHSDACVAEIADLWFHTMVLLSQIERSSDDVLAVLAERFGISGHAEKASRSS